jgi:hypothetical protein
MIFIFSIGMFRFGVPHGNPNGGAPFDDEVDLKLSAMTPCIGVELF